jgi:isopentenyl-diphosphate delta-isomerase
MIAAATDVLSPDTDEIVLVDESDRPVGYDSKLPPHQNGGRLHRAFSVFIFDSAGRMLLQQRAAGKYHFPLLWTNACCSHPRKDQPVGIAALARLQFEFGFQTPLQHLFSFTYRAEDPISGLTEHEFDHVFVGRFDGEPQPNPAEIADYRWVLPAELLEDVRQFPRRYTPWFKLVLERVLDQVAVATA